MSTKAQRKKAVDQGRRSADPSAPEWQGYKAWKKLFPRQPSLSAVLKKKGKSAETPVARKMLRQAQMDVLYGSSTDWIEDTDGASQLSSFAECLADLDDSDLLLPMDNTNLNATVADGLGVAVERVILTALKQNRVDDMEPFITAVCDHLRDHKAQWPHALYCNVGHAIDCWSQMAGVEVDNPTGCYEMITGAAARGWKNPRRSRPERGKKV